MNIGQQENRQGRLIKKIFDRFTDEAAQEVNLLKSRPDFRPELEYFVDLLAAGRDPATIANRTGRKVVALMCLQAPLELFHVYGLQPFKIFGGTMVAQRLSAPQLPAIMCPMLRSALGELHLDLAGRNGEKFLAWVAPTTCDWVVKIKDMMEVCGVKEDPPFHRLELPHLKDRDESQERWLEEIYLLKTFLSELTGIKKIKRQDLANSMRLYQKTWHVFSRLIDLKRQGFAPLVWFMVITNSFFFDDVEKWSAAVEKALPLFTERPKNGPNVFLAGSPIFFPNLKMLHLLEEAGLNVVMDDLCSSERIFPGAVFCDDLSEHGLLKALAQRYHQGCLCPTFSDNDRRINNIIAPAHKDLYQGVVFHVLKGCHPFDLESLTLESRLKDLGFKFIKLETDYTSEDSQTLLTRLEAYRSSLVN
ncbi:MAG: 2-hydroxyacyl-CoA dehydratase family protein [Deltaproteobacteria bacterium]|jgi:benzoyl-CoA reductase/2-hydroxyglutaryl-CoA dehydratase subunit BcrC/BadD/HgdB|nr:2-hydroxyacyl-CoA dehydratase family protein [Deltaproteobacteria bacterium]